MGRCKSGIFQELQTCNVQEWRPAMAINFSKEDKEKMEHDKSEIYTKRTDESYAEYVKNLKGRKKGRYFADYYLKFVIAAVIVVAGLIYFVRDAVVTKPSAVLSIAIEGDAIEDENLVKFAEIIEDELNLDTEHEKVNVFIATGDKQLQTFLYTGQVDIIISTEEKFQKWAEAGYFFEPGSTEELSFYNGFPEDQKFYSHYISSEDIRNSEQITDAEPSDKKLYNYGIYLTGTDKYAKELGGLVPEPVAGVSASSKNIDYAVSFLKYMTSK